jgi:hypothetical protein
LPLFIPQIALPVKLLRSMWVEKAGNQPMLDLLWRTIFRWRAQVRRVTGDAKYGTKEIVAAVEKASIRAYVSMADFESRSPYSTGRAGSPTTPSKISTGARKGNPCAFTPTPTPRG